MKNLFQLIICLLPILVFGQSTEISLNLGHTDAITGLRFSKDSKFLLSSSADGTMKLWDVESGKLLHTSKKLNEAYAGPIFLFPDQQLVSFMPASERTHNWIWNYKNGTMEDGSHLSPKAITIAPPSLLDLEEEGQEPEGPTFEEKLSNVFNRIEFTNGFGYEHTGLYTNEAYHYQRTNDQVNYFGIWDEQSYGTITYPGLSEKFSFSSNGQFLFGTSDQVVTIWEQSTGKVLTKINLPASTLVNDVSPNGKSLLVTDRQGQSSLYDVANQKRQAIGQDLPRTQLPNSNIPVDKVSFNQALISPNGQYIARGTAKGGIYLHSYKSRKVKRVLQGYTQPVTTVQFSTDEPVLQCQLQDGSWRNWNLSSGIVKRIASQPTPASRPTAQVMAWSDDRQWALVNNNDLLELWDKAANQKIKDIGDINTISPPAHAIEGALFTPDKKHIFFQTRLEARRAVTTNLIWSIEQNKEIQTVVVPISRGTYASTFSPDSRQLLLSDGDGNIQIVAIGQESEAQISAISSDPITQMVFSKQDHTKLAVHSATPDGAVKLIDVASQKVLATLHNLGEQDWVIIAENGLFDASPGAMNQLFYKIEYEGETEIIELEQLKSRYYEPGLLQELMGYSTEKPRNIDKLSSVALYPKIVKAEIQDNQLKLAIKERNGGMGKLSLFINGKEVEENLNPRQSPNLQIDLKNYAKYYYPGQDNQISLRSFNAEGWLKSQAYELAYTPTFVDSRGENGTEEQGSSSRNSKPHLYGLIVGTAKYSGGKLNLTYSDKDAASIHKALQSAGKALFNERVDLQLLSTDPEAGGQVSSKSNIKKALISFATKAKAEDVFVIYFAGHGITYGQAEKLQFYYLTKDISTADLSDPEIRSNYAISSKELTTWLTAIPAQKQVMMLDACNSGKVVENLMSMRALNSSQIRALDRMRDRTGMFVISGSAADKVSYEASQYGQGLLTYSLLKGMQAVSATNSSYIDVMQLFQYSRDQVPQLAKGIGGIQTPMLAFPSDGSSFDIGIVNASVNIPVAQVKPIFIRNNFQDEAAFRDVLGLGQKVADQFKAISSRGADAQYIYVDASELANAYSVNGRYSVTGETVKVKGVLIRGNKTIGPFEVSGKKGDLKTLVEDIIYEVEGMVE
ncbi:MAG: caspase family protein [Saprospiraceae bacterium]|nr:caspase family protein [Saprospiraceae bacterium]